MKLSRNFHDYEFRNEGIMEVDPILITKLQALRDIVGHPILITSGVRTIKENREAGGAINSQHLKGRAVDISTNGWGSTRKYMFLKKAFSLDFSGIAMGNSFIHLDVRPGVHTTWTY
jgi:uncharacterized protein YcbK (DUF882 family)